MDKNSLLTDFSVGKNNNNGLNGSQQSAVNNNTRVSGASTYTPHNMTDTPIVYTGSDPSVAKKFKKLEANRTGSFDPYALASKKLSDAAKSQAPKVSISNGKIVVTAPESVLKSAYYKQLEKELQTLKGADLSSPTVQDAINKLNDEILTNFQEAAVKNTIDWSLEELNDYQYAIQTIRGTNPMSSTNLIKGRDKDGEIVKKTPKDWVEYWREIYNTDDRYDAFVESANSSDPYSRTMYLIMGQGSDKPVEGFDTWERLGQFFGAAGNQMSKFPEGTFREVLGNTDNANWLDQDQKNFNIPVESFMKNDITDESQFSQRIKNIWGKTWEELSPDDKAFVIILSRTSKEDAEDRDLASKGRIRLEQLAGLHENTTLRPEIQNMDSSDAVARILFHADYDDYKRVRDSYRTWTDWQQGMDENDERLAKNTGWAEFAIGAGNLAGTVGRYLWESAVARGLTGGDVRLNSISDKIGGRLVDGLVSRGISPASRFGQSAMNFVANLIGTVPEDILQTTVDNVLTYNPQDNARMLDEGLNFDELSENFKQNLLWMAGFNALGAGWNAIKRHKLLKDAAKAAELETPMKVEDAILDQDDIKRAYDNGGRLEIGDDGVAKVVDADGVEKILKNTTAEQAELARRSMEGVDTTTVKATDGDVVAKAMGDQDLVNKTKAEKVENSAARSAIKFYGLDGDIKVKTSDYMKANGISKKSDIPTAAKSFLSDKGRTMSEIADGIKAVTDVSVTPENVNGVINAYVKAVSEPITANDMVKYLETHPEEAEVVQASIEKVNEEVKAEQPVEVAEENPQPAEAKADQPWDNKTDGSSTRATGSTFADEIAEMEKDLRLYELASRGTIYSVGGGGAEYSPVARTIMEKYGFDTTSGGVISPVTVKDKIQKRIDSLKSLDAAEVKEDVYAEYRNENGEVDAGLFGLTRKQQEKSLKEAEKSDAAAFEEWSKNNKAADEKYQEDYKVWLDDMKKFVDTEWAKRTDAQNKADPFAQKLYDKFEKEHPAPTPVEWGDAPKQKYSDIKIRQTALKSLAEDIVDSETRPGVKFTLGDDGWKDENNFNYLTSGSYRRALYQKGYDNLDAKTKKIVDKADNMFTQRLTDDTVLYRGETMSAAKKRNLKVGDELDTSAWTYTQFLPEYTDIYRHGITGNAREKYMNTSEGVLYRYHMKSGSPVFHKPDYIYATDEGTHTEFIIPRGAKATVTNIEEGFLEPSAGGLLPFLDDSSAGLPTIRKGIIVDVEVDPNSGVTPNLPPKAPEAETAKVEPETAKVESETPKSEMPGVEAETPKAEMPEVEAETPKAETETLKTTIVGTDTPNGRVSEEVPAYNFKGHADALDAKVKSTKAGVEYWHKNALNAVKKELRQLVSDLQSKFGDVQASDFDWVFYNLKTLHKKLDDIVGTTDPSTGRVIDQNKIDAMKWFADQPVIADLRKASREGIGKLGDDNTLGYLPHTDYDPANSSYEEAMTGALWKQYTGSSMAKDGEYVGYGGNFDGRLHTYASNTLWDAKAKDVAASKLVEEAAMDGTPVTPELIANARKAVDGDIDLQKKVGEASSTKGLKKALSSAEGKPDYKKLTDDTRKQAEESGLSKAIHDIYSKVFAKSNSKGVKKQVNKFSSNFNQLSDNMRNIVLEGSGDMSMYSWGGADMLYAEANAGAIINRYMSGEDTNLRGMLQEYVENHSHRSPEYAEAIVDKWISKLGDLQSKGKLTKATAIQSLSNSMRWEGSARLKKWLSMAKYDEFNDATRKTMDSLLFSRRQVDAIRNDAKVRQLLTKTLDGITGMRYRALFYGNFKNALLQVSELSRLFTTFKWGDVGQMAYKMATDEGFRNKVDMYIDAVAPSTKGLDSALYGSYADAASKMKVESDGVSFEGLKNATKTIDDIALAPINAAEAYKNRMMVAALVQEADNLEAAGTLRGFDEKLQHIRKRFERVALAANEMGKIGMASNPLARVALFLQNFQIRELGMHWYNIKDSFMEGNTKFKGAYNATKYASKVLGTKLAVTLILARLGYSASQTLGFDPFGLTNSYNKMDEDEMNWLDQQIAGGVLSPLFNGGITSIFADLYFMARNAYEDSVRDSVTDEAREELNEPGFFESLNIFGNTKWDDVMSLDTAMGLAGDFIPGSTFANRLGQMDEMMNTGWAKSSTGNKMYTAPTDPLNIGLGYLFGRSATANANQYNQTYGDNLGQTLGRIMPWHKWGDFDPIDDKNYSDWFKGDENDKQQFSKGIYWFKARRNEILDAYKKASSDAYDEDDIAEAKNNMEYDLNELWKKMDRFVDAYEKKNGTIDANMSKKLLTVLNTFESTIVPNEDTEARNKRKQAGYDNAKERYAQIGFSPVGSYSGPTSAEGKEDDEVRYWGSPQYQSAVTGSKDIENEVVSVLKEADKQLQEVRKNLQEKYSDAMAHGKATKDYSALTRLQYDYLKQFDKVVAPIIAAYGRGVLSKDDVAEQLNAMLSTGTDSRSGNLIPSEHYAKNKWNKYQSMPLERVDVKKWAQQRYSSDKYKTPIISATSSAESDISDIKRLIRRGNDDVARAKALQLKVRVDNQKRYLTSEDYKWLTEYLNHKETK